MKHKRSIISIAMATIMLISLCAVYASTSVNAASSSSRASVQATPDLVGAPIAAGTGPSACILNGTTDMYVFVQGNDGALWYRIWSTALFGWTGSWVSLGGGLTSSPCAVSPEAGYLDVYVRGTDGAVYQQPYSSGEWHGWYNIGGQVAPGTGPGVSGWTGREDLFVQGTDAALYVKTFISPSGWSGWTKLGGVLTSSPAAVSQFPGEIDVIVRGTNGAVYLKSFGDGAWQDWFMNLGGRVAPGTGLAITYLLGVSDLFVQGTNGALYHRNNTSSWENLGGKLTSSPTAATFTYNGTTDIEVFVRGTNGNIYLQEFYDGVWHRWVLMGQGPP